MRCRFASSRILAVVDILSAEETLCRGFFEGDTERERAPALWLVTMRDVSGDTSVASVVFGSANLSTAGTRGFILLSGVVIVGSPGATGSAISFALLGVGVAGGGGVLAFCTRRLLGVVGAFVGASFAVSVDMTSAVAFLLRPFCFGADGGVGADVFEGACDAVVTFSEAANRRADLRVAIFAIG